MVVSIDNKTKKKILKFQQNEINEHHIYEKLSASLRDEHNRNILKHISADELRHYNIWKKYTGKDLNPSGLIVWKYCLISRLLGMTFGLKLMENGEEEAQESYDKISEKVPEAARIKAEEDGHEKKLLDMINEEKLKYVGSIVLGLNDALVELTGALAGFTFAFQNSGIIALAGLITGVAASLSMGASEYLSTKSEGSENEEKSPAKASFYTSLAYIFTVVFLILPFFILTNVYVALGTTLANAIIVIFIFTFYISVAKDLNFRRRFAEMALISIGVAALTFAIGFLIRVFFGIEI
ncbi:MAG: VIT1/CCC1 transporter family protein [Candidatus Aenigmarchaeota archaeon]|nr:VIT1/CCC1 transporter family protein [Candidatus Aenigmarchaeota archaeon]